MERLIFDSEEMKKIRDLLIDSDAVRCESVSPETPFPGVNSYLLFSSTHRVIVDFNKMATTCVALDMILTMQRSLLTGGHQRTAPLELKK